MRRAAASGQLRRRSPPERRAAAAARPRSDLGARIVVAIPAIAVAALVVWRGGIVFAVARRSSGGLCLHELYALTARAHPAPLAGFAALLALCSPRTTATATRSSSSPSPRCR